MKRLLVITVFLLASCGGSFDDSERLQYIDTCIIEAGPQAKESNVTDYCWAKWRQSQREKESER